MPLIPLGGQEPVRGPAAAVRTHSPSSVSRPAAAPRQPDSVSISDTARSLGAARAAVAAASDVREDRVSALKAALADGTYSIDSRGLAAKLLKSSTS